MIVKLVFVVGGGHVTSEVPATTSSNSISTSSLGSFSRSFTTGTTTCVEESAMVMRATPDDAAGS